MAVGVYGNTAYPVGDGGFEAFITTPRQANFFGQGGWWSVPQQWYCVTDPVGQIWVSPNQFTDPTCVVKPSPVYAAKTNQDGGLVFQDAMRNLRSGNSNPFNRF